MVAVISLSSSGKANHHGMMEIIIPHAVESMATFGKRLKLMGPLALAFAHQNDLSIAGGFASTPAHGGEDMLLMMSGINDGLCCVKA